MIKIGLSLRGDAKIDYRRFARACERIIQTPVISRHRDDGPARGRLSPFQSKRGGSRHLLSYASANRRGARVTYPAVCSKGVTLLGKADRADRKPQSARNRTSGWNVRWPAIRAWGNTTPEYWIDGRPIRGLFRRRQSVPCAARRSHSSLCAPSAGREAHQRVAL